MLWRCLVVGLCLIGSVEGFSVTASTEPRTNCLLFSANGAGEQYLECTTVDENSVYKQELLELAASYDRGYGASPSARRRAMEVIQKLEACNTEFNASRGIEGDSMTRSPLTGNWRMIWTTALDVLSLQASPLFTAGAIYQVFEPPIVPNVIDFLPRAQTLLPPDLVPNTLFRARVQTRACERPNRPNRIGLVFERVQFQPLQVLGLDIDFVPPIALDLPRIFNIDQTDENAPGFFDVSYLDSSLLIIRQNDPGGLFALVKVDSIEA